MYVISTSNYHFTRNCGKGCGDHSTVAGDMKYLGCFQYYHNPQRLAGPWHTESIRNTVDRCIDFCLLGNLKYAGAQNGYTFLIPYIFQNAFGLIEKIAAPTVFVVMKLFQE